MIDDVAIVPLAPAALPLLANVADDVFDEPINETRAAIWAGAAHHIGALAVHDGVVIGQIRGYLQCHPDGDPQAMVDNLGVAPAFHRQGIATQLWAGFTSEAKRAGATAIYVLTDPDNAIATQFYASLKMRRSRAVLFEAALTSAIKSARSRCASQCGTWRRKMPRPSPPEPFPVITSTMRKRA